MVGHFTLKFLRKVLLFALRKVDRFQMRADLIFISGCGK